MHGRNFVVNRGVQLGVKPYDQHGHRVDVEVKFCKYRLPILFSRSVLKATM